MLCLVADYTVDHRPECFHGSLLMIPIRGVYEVAIRVKNLARAEPFYREVLGLEVGIRDERRNWLFLRAGDGGMVVLQEDTGDWPTQHFALTVSEADIDKAADALREAVVDTRSFTYQIVVSNKPGVIGSASGTRGRVASTGKRACGSRPGDWLQSVETGAHSSSSWPSGSLK